jgi:hypothetical protein
VDLLRASGVGTVVTLLGQPEAQRDPGFLALAREAVFGAIAWSAPTIDAPGAAGAAIALRASLRDDALLTAGERLLLGELLDRLAATGSRT